MNGNDTTRRPPRRGARREGGFSFVEVLLATLLTAYAVATIDALFIAGANKALLNSVPATARQFANEIRVLARTLPREATGVTGATSVDEVVALDSLHGASFSPPIRADLDTYDEYSGWTQSVSLSMVGLDASDPLGAVSTLPAEGLDEAAAGMFRLEVSIWRDGELVDTFTWWIRP